MPFDSNGQHSLPLGYNAVTGQTVLASQHNPPLEDVSSSLSQVLLRSGVAPMVGNLSMNGFKITGLVAGTAATDAVNKAQLDTAVTAPTSQVFPATGTWTKPNGCLKAVFEAVGGGAGGGGVDGQGAGTAAAGGGGSSGFYGKTGMIDVSGTSSAAVTIGAGGAGGAAGENNGTAGGDTAITIGVTTYTWGGGLGGVGTTAAAGVKFGSMSGSPTGTNVVGAGGRGREGFSSGDDTMAAGGEGGGTEFGVGGFPPRSITIGSIANGANASAGFGGGGSGGLSCEAVSNAAGGDGAGGYMRVWEFY